MIAMFPTLSHVFAARSATVEPKAQVLESPAAALLNSANAVAGQDPDAARALRTAAMAWLSVVR